MVSAMLDCTDGPGACLLGANVALCQTRDLEALLLSIEALSRAGYHTPNSNLLKQWYGGRLVESHLALLCVHVAIRKGKEIDEGIFRLLSTTNVPLGDSLLGRIRDKMSSTIE